jgi:hypothetical protein
MILNAPKPSLQEFLSTDSQLSINPAVLADRASHQTCERRDRMGSLYKVAQRITAMIRLQAIAFARIMRFLSR